jgi:cytochrome c5
VLLAAPSSLRAADESGLRLAEGAGRERVQAACSMCHSVDYIVMNSPFQDAAAWEKTVNKMIKVYGAPLSPEEAAAIVAYLGEHYGK